MVKLLEAYNITFSDYILSICETTLNENIELPEAMLENYTFAKSNCPTNIARGADSTKITFKVKNGLSFGEAIVSEMKQEKKVFSDFVWILPPAKPEATTKHTQTHTSLNSTLNLATWH